MFFSIDGCDGVGKSTQRTLFREWLEKLGHQVVACRDPGSTATGEAIREILLHRDDMHIAERTEMLLYMAARAQLVEEVIRPALTEGKTVLSDRYLLANVVYQGYGRRLEVDRLWQIGEVATDGVMPDLTIVLDLPVEVASKRLTGGLDRMERAGIEFHSRVREGFLAEAAKSPETITVVDASGPIDEVQAAVRAAARRVLEDMPPLPMKERG